VPIVLNEWVIHDLRGENGSLAQRQSAEFLQLFQRSADHIVVLRRSPWTTKAFNLMTVSTPPVRILSKFLHLSILQDSLKCRYVEAEEIQPLPWDLAEQIPNDDAYLFQTALAVVAPIIVTSDVRLIERVATLARERGVQMRQRDEFLAGYRE